MTKNDLFRLIIKIFGLYSVITVIFSAFPSNITFVLSNIDLFGILWLVGSLLIVVFLFLFLIYKPDKIIYWLKLDKGFDDDRFEFQNFNQSTILKLAFIVIGGVIMINNVPVFLSHIFFAFTSSFGPDLMNRKVIITSTSKDGIYLVSSTINIIIGYFMVTNYNYFSKIIKEKNKEND
jgi:hypothetical protein